MNKMMKLSSVSLLALTLAACGGGASYTDGTYTGEATGFNEQDPIQVTVTVAEGKISDIVVDSHAESLGHDGAPETEIQMALEELPATMVEKNTTDVDVIAGATYTSTGVKDAVNAALEGAK
ncbi:MAG: FMN-binding protein [Tissierellia bacterium]|nr:FMN-binding protein [Tissierellia bacterium]